MHDTSFSLTLRPADLIRGPLATTFQALERSVSLPERITLMEVLTSTLSLISGVSSGPETVEYLMWKASTQTLAHLEAIQEADTTMRRRMEISSRGVSRGRAEEELLRLRLHGIGSSLRHVLKLFETTFGNWLRKKLYSGPERSNTISPRNTLSRDLPTFIQWDSSLTWEWYLTWLSGEDSVLTSITWMVSTFASSRQSTQGPTSSKGTDLCLGCWWKASV
jgi:hypothetical protein